MRGRGIKAALLGRIAARRQIARRKFWTSLPTHRNAVELFDGEWLSNLSEVDPTLPNVGLPMFVADERPRQAAQSLGADGSFDDMSILELGPLEGAHSYQLEQLGAREIIAIEGNATCFLRCLAVKNMFALDRTTFLLGDCVSYLRDTDDTFDMIFASGILYHMADPVDFIRLMCARTDKIFVWTQYFHPDYPMSTVTRSKPVEKTYDHDGLSMKVYEFSYKVPWKTTFAGGLNPTARWLPLDGIIAAFRHYRFGKVDVIVDKPDDFAGPSATLAFQRDRDPDDS